MPPQSVWLAQLDPDQTGSFRRGVRQGCPLSGQLYALAIEPFLCLHHRRLTELVLCEPELRLLLSAYADDILLVVQDPGDLARVEVCQAIYSAASSARVNWVKSSGLAVGDWRQCKLKEPNSCLESFHISPQSETRDDNGPIFWPKYCLRYKNSHVYIRCEI
ncbi:unnamed protein product [Caretta caretta]